MAAYGCPSSSEDVLMARKEHSDLYRDKVLLAPMVRVGTLPFRLLAAELGADLVYSEETIDWKLLRSSQRFNEALGSTEWYDAADGTVFLRTCERERTRLVVQLGTSDPARALKVARMVEPFVAGIDVNCGCPKEFSIKGGMGAALLTQPQKIKQILTTLVRGLSVPVTCKIRILPDLEDTLTLCRMIERCGVAALTVHGRTKTERPQHANHEDVISRVASVLSIPVIANGGSREIQCYDDIAKFKARTGASSVMIARAAMWNCSVLSCDGMLPLDDVIKRYLTYCIHFDNQFTYTKYTVQNMLRDLQESPRGKAFLETQTMREIAEIFGLASKYDEAMLLQKKVLSERSASINEIGIDQRKWAYKHRDEIDVKVEKDPETGELRKVAMPMQFIRGNFCNADLPKMVLNRHATSRQMKDPVFKFDVHDRFFIGKVCVDGVEYITNCIEKSRRYAEQAAAMVYLHHCGLVEPEYGFTASHGSRRYQHLAQDAGKTPRRERQEAQAQKTHVGRNRRRQHPNPQPNPSPNPEPNPSSNPEPNPSSNPEHNHSANPAPSRASHSGGDAGVQGMEVESMPLVNRLVEKDGCNGHKASVCLPVKRRSDELDDSQNGHDLEHNAENVEANKVFIAKLEDVGQENSAETRVLKLSKN